MPVDSQLVEAITREVMRQLKNGAVNPAGYPSPPPPGSRRIPVGVSVRHVHLCQEHIDILFGAGHGLTRLRPLPQPGEFVAAETVTLVGPRLKAMENVRVLGDVRRVTQVEVSRTDGYALGVHPPVRRSGDLEGTPGVTLIGPAGSLTLERGLIIPNRHIHMNPGDAAYFGVGDGQEVDVRVVSERSAILGQVQIRVGGPGAVLYMHLDTDDANAAAMDENTRVEILPAEVTKCCWLK